MLFQHENWTRLNIGEHGLWIKRGKQNPRVLLYDTQQGIVISASPVSSYSVQILPVVFVPQSEVLQIERLFFFFQRLKCTLGTFFHHVMEPISHAVRQTFYKCVFCNQYGKQLFCIRVSCDEACHFHGKLIGKPHDCQKLPLLFWERVNHGSGERSVNVGIMVRQYSVFEECP